MERDGSSSPRHSDKSHSHAAAAAAAARATSASAQAAAATAAAFNYSAFLNASVSGGDSVMLGSTENLLRNIQGLLKVAAENARQQDRQANYEKGKNPTKLRLCVTSASIDVIRNDSVSDQTHTRIPN